MGPIIAAVRTAATQLVNDRLGTAGEPSQYVLGQIIDPFTPAPVVTPNPDDVQVRHRGADHRAPRPSIARSWRWPGCSLRSDRWIPAASWSSWTDASAKDSARSESVSALAQSKQIRVYFMLFGSCSPIDPALHPDRERDRRPGVLPDAAGRWIRLRNFPCCWRGRRRSPALGPRRGRERLQGATPSRWIRRMADVTFSADTESMEVQATRTASPCRRATRMRRRSRSPAARSSRSAARRSGPGR